MSGFEKWNRRESALCRLKEFLLRERPAARESLNSSTGSDASIALDLDQSFQKIIQSHMEKRTKNMENKENIQKSGGENTSAMKENRKSNVKNSTNETMYTFDDTTLLQDCSSDSDSDSFEELERMCNKTLSDPNNTIHQYLARRKLSKRSSVSSDPGNESACILRLLKDINEQLEEGKVKFGDQTQLNDIEAPSGLWESTIGGDMASMLMTPDRVAKFQPRNAAILEEATNETSGYKSLPNVSELPTIDEYVTANETVATEKYLNSNCNPTDENESGVSDGSVTPTNATFATATEEIVTGLDNLSFKNCDKSIDLICLDDNMKGDGSLPEKQINCALGDTFYVTPRRNKSQGKLSMLDNLIDLNSTQPDIKREVQHEDPIHSQSISGDTVILLSDDEETINDNSESHNTAFSLDLEESTKSDTSLPHEKDTPRDFNDTLEEIDYIMKQGMKYLADSRQLPKCLQNEEMLSPSPMSSPQTPITVIKKSKKKLPWEKPKQPEEFKKPRAFTKIPQCKTLPVGKKPINFQHIVSPVGAYIKNTPKTPITTDFKPTFNVFQTKVVRGLDYSFSESIVKKNDHVTKECFSGLPKKAYISSDIKHVVDQRKPMTIPGGEKIHRFLQPSKMPAVIRHEGKIKSNAISHSRQTLTNKADNSLADLSTVSGDISLHILKDAKR